MKTISEMISVPRENMQNLVISVIVVAVFVSAAIIPGYLSKHRLDEKIHDAQRQLYEANNLLPLYQSLLKEPQTYSSTLAAPDKSGLDKAELDKAYATLRGIVDKAGMTVIAVGRDQGSAAKDMKIAAVDVSLKGNFENFRTVLTNIGALSYVERVETLSIRRESNGRKLDFRIKLILAMK